MLRLVSFGAGVQSTALLLMGIRGEFGDVPDAAIFADTGWEPAETYRHLEWIEREVAPFPILRVSGGNIREQAENIHNGKRFVSVPGFIRNPDGSKGIGRRQCTAEFKVRPILKKVREILRERGERVAEQWIGISLDEVQRMKDSRVKYSVNRWPLIEKRLTRHDCERWLLANGYPVPRKSACIGCPFHSNSEWRAIRSNPEEWQQAVEFDKSLRQQRKMRGEVFLHPSLIPLESVDLRTSEEKGQLNLFLNECEGLCGV